MKISLLSHSLSGNCLGRAYILAEVLSRKYDVEIIGPIKENGIWKPLEKSDIRIKSVPFYNYPDFKKSAKQLLDFIDGDVIYAIKPRPTSFGIGILKKRKHKLPLILDIDDLEEAFTDTKVPFFAQLKDPDSHIYVQLIQLFSRFADQITTVSGYLNKRYGNRGAMVPHGRDAKIFDPKLYDALEQKRNLGLENHKIIMFSGAALPHKGLEDIINAVKKIKNHSIKVVCVGAKNYYLTELINKHPDLIHHIEQQHFHDIPKFLSSADMIVLPQRDEGKAKGQIPVKMIDAMAMAKPVISTNISDIPKILDGCGIIVGTGNIEELAGKIKYVLENPDKAEKLGKAARVKFEKYYTYDVMEKELLKVFSKYENTNK